MALVVYSGAIGTRASLSFFSSDKKTNEQSAGLYILGPARALLSDGLYVRADTYFHKGVPHLKNEAFHGLFQKWKEALCPVEHAHAEGREIEELLPWLRLATQSDPHNVEAYLVASFWLQGDCARPDLALTTIVEAIEKNPGRYELHLEMARIYLSSDEYELASASLQRALNLIIQPNQADPDQVTIDLPFIYMARSYLFEALEDQKSAVLATENYLKLHREMHFIDRLSILKSQSLDSVSAKSRLHELFHKTHQCERDDSDCDHEHCDH